MAIDNGGAATRPRLLVRRLSKRYGNVQALAEVDFELRPGEVMALLGENGAGKSTLVKVLSGLVQPDFGTIEIDGRAGRALSERPLAGGGRGGRAPGVQLRADADGRREPRARPGRACRPCGCRGVSTRAPASCLPAVGLEHLDPRTPVERLSVAEMQLLEIARLLVRDARILIFDEPTAALADREIERVLAVIKRLAGEGRSVIYVTHRLPEVFRIADRVTVFRNGRSLPAATDQRAGRGRGHHHDARPRAGDDVPRARRHRR